MKTIRCSTQDELDKAQASKSPVDIWLIGTGSFWIADSAQVRAYGSAQVTASGSAQVRASGSAQVTAYGSAQVTASDSAQVRASDSAQVRASKYVAVTRHAKTVKVNGGVLIEIPPITSVAMWCEFYGLDVVDGVVTLYKGLDATFRSEHGTDYTPGTIPVAADWDGGKAECGGGLHFSPRPVSTLTSCAVKFVACPVAVADIRVPKEGDIYPEKVKARGCCGPVYEVTIHGDRVEVQS